MFSLGNSEFFSVNESPINPHLSPIRDFKFRTIKFLHESVLTWLLRITNPSPGANIPKYVKLLAPSSSLTVTGVFPNSTYPATLGITILGPLALICFLNEPSVPLKLSSSVWVMKSILPYSPPVVYLPNPSASGNALNLFSIIKLSSTAILSKLVSYSR